MLCRAERRKASDLARQGRRDASGKAADLFLRALEYFTPKRARADTKVEGELEVTRLVIERCDREP